jgi:hypothetical protein
LLEKLDFQVSKRDNNCADFVCYVSLERILHKFVSLERLRKYVVSNIISKYVCNSWRQRVAGEPAGEPAGELEGSRRDCNTMEK